MKRLQQLRIKGTFVYCFNLLWVSLVGFAIAHFFAEPESLLHHYTAYCIGRVVCILILVAQVLLNYRKQIVVPTPSELTSSVRNGDFSNSFAWLHLLAILFFIFFVFVIFTLPLPRAYILTLPLMHWMVIAFICLIFILPDVLYFRDQYVIEEDMLIIREGYGFCRNQELRIPLDTIDEVYLKNTWTLRPTLFINVNGIHRQLHATTHSVELAIALACHFRKNKF